MVEIINKDIFNGVAGKRSGKPKGVVIHNDAGSKNATAKWYLENFLPGRYKAGQSNLGFAHYYIDRNTITRVENTNNKAWHTANSDGNSNYIGYEVCQSVGESEANFKLNEEMTFRQVAEDLQFYGLSANRDTIRLHKQFTSTSCPHRSVALHGDNTKVQDYFIERVKHYMSLGKTVADMLKKSETTNDNENVPDSNKKTIKVGTQAKQWQTGSDIPKFVIGQTYDVLQEKAVSQSKSKKAYLIGKGTVATGWLLEQDVDGFKNETVSKPTNNKKRVYLPKSAKTWRVYKTSGPYTTGKEVGFLAPAQYGGLDYEILKTLATDVYEIKTSAFGNVAIYAAKSTGATIK